MVSTALICDWSTWQALIGPFLMTLSPQLIFPVTETDPFTPPTRWFIVMFIFSEVHFLSDHLFHCSRFPQSVGLAGF